MAQQLAVVKLQVPMTKMQPTPVSQRQ